MSTTAPVAGDGATESAADAPGDWRVEVIDDLAGLDAIADEWAALGARASVDHPFLQYAWVRTWWECFGSGLTLHVLAVRSGSQLVAVAPFVARERRLYGLRVRALELMVNDHTPRFDFLLSDRMEESCAVVWRFLRDGHRSWDLLSLRQLPDDGVSVRGLVRLARRSGYRVGLRETERSPYVELDGDWPAYTQRLGRTRQSKIRRAIARLEAHGPVRLEVVGCRTGLDEALADMLRIEAAAWKARNGTAMISCDDVRRFYVRLAERSAAEGRLRLVFLRVGERRVAAAYALEQGRRTFVLKTGYDPAFARFSPSRVLFWLALEDACRRGVEQFDFLGAAEAWKLEWTDRVRGQAWLFVFAPGARMLALHAVKCRLVPLLLSYPAVCRLRAAWHDRRRRQLRQRVD